LSLYEDQNDNLWVGQNNGISFIELKSPSQIINEEVGLPGTGYSAIQKDNNLYLGTNNGVFLNSEQKMSLIEGSEGQVYNLQLINNDLFISHNNGAFILSNEKAKPIDDGTGTWMFIKFQDHLFQGTYDGIKILNPATYVQTGKVDNLTESSRVMVKENDSTLWMSHAYKGVYKIQSGSNSNSKTTIEYFNQQNGLPTNLSNSVHLVEGQLIVTTQSGIFSYDDKSSQFNLHKSLNNHFLGEQIIILKSDIYGNVYFITTKTAGFLEKLGNKKYQKHFDPFNTIRKLLNDDLSNISIISPNIVFFGAKEGFIKFDRNLFWTTEKETFNTIIRKVTYDGEKTADLYNGSNHSNYKNNRDHHPKISYNNNNISFYFSSTSFSSTILPEFQYKLDGFEKEWQEWTENNYKEYTNLKEGFYTFKVKSRNASNLESEIVSYSFLIIYPWYRSPIAYIIYVLIVIFFLTGALMSLDKRHQIEKKKLEQKRILQLSEKQEQLNSVTKKSEYEINLLKNEKLKSEITHMNTELATNTMHLLNKNEFINSMKTTLAGVIKKSSNQEVQGLIKRVIKDIEKNIKTDGDWQNFQIHFDKVHGDFSNRIKQEFPGLSPQEIKLSTYLRLNLSTKEIANLLNITVRGVEIARYRLRKKLQLERVQNLAEFILNY